MMYEGCKIEWGIMDPMRHIVLGAKDDPLFNPVLYDTMEDARKAKVAVQEWCPGAVMAFVQTTVRSVMDAEPKKV
jgi:predicted alpha/beta-fold hydrolase